MESLMTIATITTMTVMSVTREAEGGFSCISNPCSNGICIDLLNSSFSCYCTDGYTGLQCQTNWDECWSAPCLNGATCIDLVADLTCICAPGYTGEYCGSEINECLSNPCQNNGTCEDLLDQYICTCPLGYEGDNCEIDISVCNNSRLTSDEEEPPKCQNGGKCIDGPGLSYHCHCPPGWSGTSCEKDVDECLMTPCYNAGVCINTPGSFACACQFGFTGVLCEEAVVFCDDNPCDNGALCVMEDYNATCYCVPDFHGSKCQHQYDDCMPYAPRCMNGGICIDGVDSFRCSCPNSTSGVLCQCITTVDGLVCDQLPFWYDGKPYEPIGGTEDIFPHWFNVSKPKNDSIEVAWTVFPTTTDDSFLYATSISSALDFDTYLSEEVTPSYEFRTSIYETTVRGPKEIPVPSSVISAKRLPSMSPTIPASVPYFSDEISASIFPSPSPMPSSMVWSESMMFTPTPHSFTYLPSSLYWGDDSLATTTSFPSTSFLLPSMMWSESFFIETTTVLPDLTSPTTFLEDYSPVLSEFLTPTTLPHVEATKVLEEPYPTASPELLSMSLFMSESDVSTTSFSLPVVSLQPTPVLSVATSALEPMSSVLIDATASPTVSLYDNVTIIPDVTEYTDKTPDIGEIFPSTTLPYDNETITIEDTSETFLPDNETDIPASTENITALSTFSDEETTTDAYTSIDYLNVTDALTPPSTEAMSQLDVNVTDESLYDVNVTSVPPDIDNATAASTLPTSTTDETLIETKVDGIFTSPSTATAGEIATPFNISVFDTTTSVASELPFTEAEYNFTMIDATEYDGDNVTFFVPGDGFNETITVPPDLSSSDDTLEYPNGTDSTTPFYSRISTEHPGVFNHSTIFPSETIPSDIPTMETDVTTRETTSTSLFPEITTSQVTDIPLLNTTVITDLSTTGDEFLVTDLPDQYNVTSLTTDVSIYDETLSTNFTTFLSTLFPTDTFPYLNDSDITYLPGINDTSPTQPITLDPSLSVGEQMFNETSTSSVINKTTDSQITSISTTTTAIVITDYTEYTEETESTGSEPKTITTMKVPDTTAASSSTEYVTATVEAKVIPPLLNVTSPEDTYLYNTTTEHVITAVTTPSVSLIPLPYVTTTDTTLPSENKTTDKDLNETDLAGSPTSVSLTTMFPDTTLQIPETPKPDDNGEPTVETPIQDPDQKGSPSKKDPVFDTTPIAPVATKPFGKDNTSGVFPPTVGGTETQSDQAPSSVCGTSYCLNGGTCIVVDGKSMCQCAFNYKGSYCELYFYIHKPYFVGASYLGVDVGSMSLRQGVQVYVQFTSQSPNGLVAYSEGPGDVFFMLLLRNSLLQFVFSCGLQTVSFLQGNEKLSRNFRTDVSVRLWWTPYLVEVPWGSGKCSASLQVNDSAPIYSEQRSSSSTVLLGLLYLGGLPSFYSSPLVVKAGFLPRLHGCISILEVNGLEVDTWVSAVSGEGIQECGSALCPPGSCRNGGSCVPGPAFWSCSCPPGYQGELCERGECTGGGGCHSGRCVPRDHSTSLCLCPQHKHGLYCELERVVERPSYSGTVQGYSSYSVYRLEYDTTHSLALKLHFTTRALRQIGLLAYLGNPVRSACQDFVALSLVRGHIMMTWDLGAGPRRLMTPEPLDSTLHTHTALLGRRGKKAWLSVDSQPNMTALSPGYLSSLNTNNLLYIGGHASWNMSHLPADMWRHEGFKGCVFDLRVAPYPGGPWTALRLAQATNVKECGTDECHQHSCKNGGRCVGLGATMKCECAVGWKGSQCETPSHVCDDGGGGSCSPGASCLLGGSRPTCLCQLGRSGSVCERDVNITDPFFSGDNSFLSLHAGNLRKEVKVRISFRPSNIYGILFLAMPRATPGDFLALTIVNASLQLTYHLGWRAPGLTAMRSKETVSLNEWQTVTFTRKGSEGALLFKGQSTKAPSKQSGNSILNVHSEVFLGGAPDLTTVPFAIGPPASRVPYRGCIREVVINDRDYDLSAPVGGEIVRGAGLTDCDGTACGRHVCLNGGTCTPAGDTFACHCPQEYTGARCQLSRACLDHSCLNGATCVPMGPQKTKRKKRRQSPQIGATLPYQCLCPPGFVGDRCQSGDEVPSVRFSGETFAVIEPGPFGNPVPNSDSFAANFSTRAMQGLILWRGQVNAPGEDYLGIGLVGGRIKIVWYLGGGSEGQLTMNGPMVSDGLWHSLVVTRADSVVTGFLDGRPQKGKTPGSYIQLNDPTGILFVGGFNPRMSVTSVTEGHFESSFVGCMKDLVVHQSSSPVRFSGLKQGRDLQPCPHL